MSMLLLAACLAAGFLFGRFLNLPESFRRIAGWAITAILFLLVFLLGAKLGSDAGIVTQFASIGTGSLALGVGCALGSVLLAGCWAVALARLKRRKG